MLFIPGWLGNPRQFMYRPLHDRLERAGYEVVVPPFGYVDLHFRNFFRTLEVLADFTRETRPTYLVGHSKGGVEALFLADEFGLPVATVGSPLRGTTSRALRTLLRAAVGGEANRSFRQRRNDMLVRVADRALTVSSESDRLAPPGAAMIEGARNVIAGGDHCRILLHEDTLEEIASFPERLASPRALAG